MPELLFFQYTHVQNNDSKFRPAFTGASDMKAGLSHMIVIICMSMYYYALVRSWILQKCDFSSFSFIKNITGRYIIYKIVVMEWW